MSLRTDFYRRVGKRTLDVVASLLGLISLSPLLLLCSVAIKLFSPGQVLFRQERIGRHGIPFTLYKFRSMRADLEKNLNHITSIDVDCDMRRPACHRSTGVENKPGFVCCLTGHEELPQAILAVPGVENLSPHPLRSHPPNPAEVLSSPIASELLRRLRTEFKYVPVDSPPLLNVADSRILATITDAVVLVARAHSTPYDAVCRARGLLYGAGARILGVALNDVDLRKDGYAYNYYYRYGYGYGYGESREKDSSGDTRTPET